VFKRDALIQVAILLAPIIVGLIVAIFGPLFLPSLRGAR
jgi:flagellar biosynthesis protein FliQ